MLAKALSVLKNKVKSIFLFQSHVVVKFMEFNIEEGGARVSLSKTIEVIKSVDPDIIAIEEANGVISQIAEMIGLKYYSNRFQIISRFPLIDPSVGNGFFMFAELEPNKIMIISNIHLPSDPYGPQEFNQGASKEDVVKLEDQIRMPMLKSYLNALEPFIQEDYPIILTGDFNAPSHIDFPEIDWPVSKAVISAGFRDSYRELFPDVKLFPGYTWWASRPKITGWNPETTDTQDRIDFIYMSGPIETIQNKIIGEIDNPVCDIVVEPWPSDHRAIVSTLCVKPAAPPVYIAVNKRAITPGEDLIVRFHTIGEAGEKILLSYPGAPVNNCNNFKNGKFNYDTKNWKVGRYEAKLLNNKNELMTSIQFYINPIDNKIILVLNKRKYRPGELIKARWYHGPGNRFDWLALIEKNRALDEENIIQSIKTDTAVVGRHIFSSVPPGNYEVLFLIDDGYAVGARVSFTVTE